MVSMRVKLINKLKRPEYIFALVASLFGVLALFVIPPGWNSDEYQHFFRVEQLANGGLFSRDPDGRKTPHSVAGGYIDSGALEFIQKNGFENRVGLDRSTITPLGLYRQHTQYTGDKVYVGFNGSAVYSPVTYIPQVAGNFINKTLGGSVYSGILLSRLFGLAAYVLIVFLAIKIIPRGKWILLTMGLLATSVVQAVALGGDAMTFSLVALFISYVLYIAYSNKAMSVKQGTLLTLLLTGVGLVKPTYFALAPLVALIPIINRKAFNKRAIIILVGSLLLAVVPTLIWMKLVSYVGTNGGEESSRGMQLQLMLAHPIDFAATMARTYLGFTPDGVWNKFYDAAFRNFVWDSVRFSYLYSILAVVAVVISLGIKDSKTAIGNTITKARSYMANFLSIGVFVVTFAVINLALYLYFSPVGSNTIVGVQARYIFPFLLLLLLPLQNYYRDQVKAKFLLVGILLTCLIASIIAIYKYIYFLN